jgi:hypothetical protein
MSWLIYTLSELKKESLLINIIEDFIWEFFL